MIKSNISETRAQIFEPDYPCLLQKSEGMVVLFTSRGCGTVVHGGTGRYRGQEGFTRGKELEWGMNYFSEFTGTVELSNNRLQRSPAKN